LATVGISYRRYHPAHALSRGNLYRSALDGKGNARVMPGRGMKAVFSKNFGDGASACGLF